MLKKKVKKNRDYLKTILLSIRFSPAPRKIVSCKKIVTEIWSQTHKKTIKNAHRSAKNSKFSWGYPLTPWREGGESPSRALSSLDDLLRRTTFKYAATALNRCGPWARQIYPSLVLVQTRKTRPCLTERLLMERKESNQLNKQSIAEKSPVPSLGIDPRSPRNKTNVLITEPKSRLSDAVVRYWLFTKSYAKYTLQRYTGESAWLVKLPLFKELIIYDDGKPF